MSCPDKTKSQLSRLFAFSLLTAGLVFLGKTHYLASVFAQGADENQVTLTAIPPRLGDDGTLKGDPGETLQTSIRVKNSSSTQINIVSQAQDFVIGADGSTPLPIIESTSTRWSLADWVTIAPNSQTIQANEVKALSVVIEIPADALPGGHYAMITHQPTPEKLDTAEVDQLTESQSGISQKVGTLLYVFVNGPINEEAYIRNFKMPAFSEYGPVPFSFSVENLSDIHIQPNINLEITNMFGKQVASINLESKNVFPLAERPFDGKFEQIWGTGKYFATLTMNYGQSGKVVIAKLSFWLFPITLVLAVIIALLVVVAMIIIIRRHLISKKNDQSARIKELENKLQDLEKKA